MTYFRRVAMTTALVLGTAGVAFAQTTIITREPATTQTVVTSQPLQLTPVQRQRIYTTVTRQAVAPATATVQYQIGMRVPESTQLYALPDDVLVEVPTVRNYRYVVVNNRVWLVDPASSEIVAEVVN
ncbi:MAG: DUF1236 domain-containing protein [Pseudolabrys sp.]|nr:DUF1236 domain-containing protein [Pseudolabrys sp.]